MRLASSRRHPARTALIVFAIATTLVVATPASPARAAAGSISGTVTRGTGGPLVGGWVEVTSVDGDASFGASTNGAGSFTVTVDPGTYCVGFGVGINNVSVAVYGGGTSCRNGATPVTVGSGVAVGAINGVVHLSAITGKLTAAENGTPIAGAFVGAIRVGGTGEGSAPTGAGGTFTIADVPPGAYCLRTFATGRGDTTTGGPPSCLPGEVPVTVAPDATSAPITIPLPILAASTTGGISGRVTAGGAPLAGRIVEAIGGSEFGFGQATTAADGTYTIAPLPPDSYCVTTRVVDVSTVAPESYRDAESCLTATRVNVASSTVTGIDLALNPGGRIGGTVTAGGAPRSAVYVTVTSLETPTGQWSANATTNVSGAYLTPMLPAGQYCVRFADAAGAYAPETYADAPGCAIGATPVTVTRGATSTANATLSSGGSLQGTITVPPGVDVTQLSLFGSGPDQGFNSVTIDGAGHWRLDHLTPGKYCFVVRNPGYNDLVTTTYGTSGRCRPNTGSIIVTEGGLTTFDVTPPLGGRISGFVVTPQGLPVNDPSVSVRTPAGEDTTDAETERVRSDGSFSLRGVPAGTWCVLFQSNTRGVGSVAYEAADTCPGGRFVTVAAGQHVGNIDIHPPSVGTISGTLHLPPAAAFRGYTVDFVPVGAGVKQSTVIDFQIDQVASVVPWTADVRPGTYCVAVRPISTVIGDRVHPDVPSCDRSPGLVTVAAAQVVAGIDITLRQPTFVALTSPVRLMDTRAGEPTVDGQAAGAGAIVGNTVRELQVAGRGGIPADATSAVLNVTAVNATGPGFLTVFPCGGTRPTASNLNVTAGQVVPNLVVTKLGTGGKVCVYAQTTVDVVVDVSGHLPLADTFTALAQPARLMDTRSGEPTVDGQAAGGGAIAAGTVREVLVTGRAGVPTGTAGVVLNVTAIGRDVAGYLTVFPCGATRPTASNLNYVAGQVTPNAVLAKVGAGGKVCLFASGDVDVAVDVSGHVPSATAFAFLAAPARLMDTRVGEPTVDGQATGTGAIAGGTVRQLQVAGRGGVPANASAVVLNVTAVGAAGPGFLTVFPCGTTRPTASNLNYTAGQVTPNAVFTRIGADGMVCVFAQSTVDVVVDTSGSYLS